MTTTDIETAHEAALRKQRNDERFTYTKHMRRPRRGGGGEVHDGYDAHDAITGVSRWNATKREAVEMAAAKVDAEERLLTDVFPADPAATYMHSYTPDQTHRHWVEIWIFTKGGDRQYLGMVATGHLGADFVDNLARYLDHVGLSHLERRT